MCVCVCAQDGFKARDYAVARGCSEVADFLGDEARVAAAQAKHIEIYFLCCSVSSVVSCSVDEFFVFIVGRFVCFHNKCATDV